eukprot:GHRR01026447.1.p1 GENE.GHRR01026447.1~~GHRR01026447.1.p1  ORF type:complete len:127 (+),score=11.14 GHRR01026447.1:166-546(+)
MPIIPDKRQLKDHVNGAVAAQFWSQGIHNARSLTGQGYTAPCEPQPLRLNAPSGLSRTQFLVAAHAVRVPVFPGFCEEHGGTVSSNLHQQRTACKHNFYISSTAAPSLAFTILTSAVSSIYVWSGA